MSNQYLGAIIFIVALIVVITIICYYFVAVFLSTLRSKFQPVIRPRTSVLLCAVCNFNFLKRVYRTQTQPRSFTFPSCHEQSRRPLCCAFVREVRIKSFYVVDWSLNPTLSLLPTEIKMISMSSTWFLKQVCLYSLCVYICLPILIIVDIKHQLIFGMKSTYQNNYSL